MITNFKSIKMLALCGLLAGTVGACRQVSSELGPRNMTAANDPQDRPSAQVLNARLDLSERRVNELMQTVRLRSEKIARWEQENVNISADAKLEAQRLKDDLKRVENDLAKTLQAIQSLTEDNVYEVERRISARLARTQDELAQIQEELRECYENK